MRVRHVGFFSDLGHGLPSSPTLKSVIVPEATESETDVVRYLKEGVLFIACPGIVTDVLSESDQVIGSPDILTDGVWAWPRDLAYYVERYHARLPDAFVQHARQNGWVVPSDVDVKALVFEA